MNWISKNKQILSKKLIKIGFTGKKNSLNNKKTKTFLLVLFLVCALLPFFDLKFVHASNALTNYVTDTAGTAFINGTRFVLVGVLNIVGWLFGIAATLFAWVIDPKNISGSNGVLNKQAVKDVWVMVRDLLNMTFILILLFAAFCTIFQVEKWNLKKVWLNILINALLVNFSYPIARFFIDVSNVAFYYFVNNLFTSTGTVTGSGIFAMFGASSNIGQLLSPDGYANYDIGYLIAMIIMLFIMGMTLLIIAGLFVVRLMALTMLIMFSPIGFVGYIFPATQSYAEDWWKSLFSYSFFAPIMIFGMAIALKVTEAIGRENMQAFRSAATANVGGSADPNWISNAAFLMIPIVILWTVIGVAKKMGIEGADKVVGSVKKGGKWLAQNPALGAGGYAWKKSGIPGGVKKGFENARKSGKILGFDNKFTQFALKDGTADREAGFAGMVSDGKGGWTKAKDKIRGTKNKDDIKDGAEKGENKEMQTLKDEIKTARTTPPATDKGKMEHAVNAKIALSRGAKYENEIEKDIKDDMRINLATSPTYVELNTKTRENDVAKNDLAAHDQFHKPVLPPPTATPNEHAKYTADMANWAAIRNGLKEKMEATKKALEVEEKKILQEAKSKHLEDLRKAIQVGENIGKATPPTP